MEFAFKKHGKKNFKFEVLEECRPEHCLAFEQVYLDYYKPWTETGKGYNICKIAGSSSGIKHSDESKKKISLARSGKKRSLEFKEKAKLKRIGCKHSEETKQKIRMSNILTKSQKVRGNV